MNFNAFLPYLATMALVTYLVRAVPLVLIKKKIENKFLLSFLYYMPYAVLAVMTVRAVFYAKGSFVTAVAGVAVSLILSYFIQGLLTVALGASGAVFIAQLIMQALQ